MTSLFRDDIGHEPTLEPPEQAPAPLCPICGRETDLFFTNFYHEIVGCSECIESFDAWEVAAE